VLVFTSATSAIACSQKLVRESFSVTVDDPVFVNVQHIYKSNVRSRGAVLMVHGAWHTSFFYHLEDHSKFSVMEYLAKRRFDTYALDMRGSGDSYKGDPTWYESITLDDIITDIRTVVTAIQERGYEQVYLIGHSLGGISAVLYTATFPETVQGLVLIGTLYQEISVPPELMEQLIFAAMNYPYIPCSPEFMPLFFAPGMVRADVLEKATELCTQQVFPSTLALQCFMLPHVGVIPMIPANIPVLLIFGELDAIGSVEDAENFLAALSSDDKTLKVISGHGHDLLLEKRPKKTQRVIFKWLKQH
jgi:alpha-beta hydrolase superfamily lysophospholipase